VVNVDQSPIGRTPRSNPATYTGLFTPIRDLFAGVPAARERGYGAGRFSFNVKGDVAKRARETVSSKSKCISCRISMCRATYATDAGITGRTLEIHYKGKSIHEVLQMTVEQATEFFSAVPGACTEAPDIARRRSGLYHAWPERDDAIRR
jgi:excinuclease ABC subunit A